jgi:hypothetical protein
MEPTPSADRLLVERDRLLGRVSFGRELVQRPLAVKVLHRGDAAGVDVGPQVAPLNQLVQRLGQLFIGVDSQLCGDVLRAQVHDEALLRPREGPEQAPVLFGVRNADMGKGLRRHGSVALRPPPAARRREHFVSHAYIVPHATDKTLAWPHSGARPSPARLSPMPGTGVRRTSHWAVSARL